MNVAIMEFNDNIEKEILRCKESYADYLETIFTILMPAVEETLIEAKKQDAMPIQKCRFNGIDYLAEILWNKNPRRKELTEWLSVFDIPSFKLHLQLYPRPIYPKSWLWSKDEAALRIQRYVRGYFVRKQDDVQEMRAFWKIMRERNRRNQ